MKVKTEEIVFKQEMGIPVDVLPEVLQLIKRFLYESFYEEMKVEHLTQRFDEIVKNQGGALFFIYKNGRIGGFFTMEVLRTEYASFTVLVNYAYLSKEMRCRKIVQQIDQIAQEWALMHRAKEISFFTRRNSDAFKRLLLPKDWSLDSVILKRMVN